MKKWEGKKGPPLHLAWSPRGLNPALGSVYTVVLTQATSLLNHLKPLFCYVMFALANRCT